MPNDNDNPVSSLGNQGSNELDSMLSGDTQSGVAGNKQDVGSTSGENLGSTSDAAGIPKKALPKDDGQQAAQSAATSQSTLPAGQTQADLIRATAEAVAQAHIRATQQQQQQQAQPQKKELSPDEFNRKYNVTRANEELVATILSGDPKKAAIALDQYGQNLVKQAILMTMELNDENLTKFREEVNPHLQSWQSYRQQQEHVAAENRFYQFAPDLAQERELVTELKDAFITKVKSGQVRFNNEHEAFTAVANAARSILKKVNPSWGQGGGQQAQTTGQPTGRRMSVASSTGRSGTPQATAKSDVDLVFGADAA